MENILKNTSGILVDFDQTKFSSQTQSDMQYRYLSYTLTLTNNTVMACRINVETQPSGRFKRCHKIRSPWKLYIVQLSVDQRLIFEAKFYS